MKNLFYLSILAVFIFTLSTFAAQDAHAAPVTLDSGSCSTYGGSWLGSTCTISSIGNSIPAADELIIPNGTTLSIASPAGGSGLINNGIITIDSGGQITTSNSGTSTTDRGLDNIGIITIMSGGQITVSNTAGGIGIFNNFLHTLTNSGTITLSNSVNSIAIDNLGTFTNNLGGQIAISGAGDGIRNNTPPNATFTNSGLITITNSPVFGIANLHPLNNTSTGEIRIQNTGGTGIANSSTGPGTITNSGLITVSNTGGDGITNNVGLGTPTITNTSTGQITISNTNLSNGIVTGTLTNSGTITVSNDHASSVGIDHGFGLITNNLGATITISNTNGVGLRNYNSASVTNNGTIDRCGGTISGSVPVPTIGNAVITCTPTITLGSPSTTTPKFGYDVTVSGTTTNAVGGDTVTVNWGDGTTTPSIAISSGLWGAVSHAYSAASIATNPHVISAEIIRATVSVATSNTASITVLKHTTTLSPPTLSSATIPWGNTFQVTGGSTLTDTDAVGGPAAVAGKTIAFSGTAVTGTPTGTSAAPAGLALPVDIVAPGAGNVGTGKTVTATFTADSDYLGSTSSDATIEIIKHNTSVNINPIQNPPISVAFSAIGELIDDDTGDGIPGEIVGFTGNGATGLQGAITNGVTVAAPLPGIIINNCDGCPDSAKIMRLPIGTNFTTPSNPSSMAISLRNMGDATVTARVTNGQGIVISPDVAAQGDASNIAVMSLYNPFGISSVQIIDVTGSQIAGVSRIQTSNSENKVITDISFGTALGPLSTMSFDQGAFSSVGTALITPTPNLLVNAGFAGDINYFASTNELPDPPSNVLTYDVVTNPAGAGFGGSVSGAPDSGIGIASLSCGPGNDSDGDSLCNNWEIGQFVAGETVYKDADANNKVSINDVRLANPPTGSAGSTVAAGNTDIESALAAFASNEKHSDPAGPNVFNVGEAVYKDADSSNAVNVGDKRLANPPSPYLANSVVAAGDTDIGTTLVAFASNEKHGYGILFTVSGATYYYPLPGSDSTKPDIYVEMDYMQGHPPDTNALNDVATVFDNQPEDIKIHYEAGGEQIAHVTSMSVWKDLLSTDLTDNNDFNSIKNDFFGTATEHPVVSLQTAQTNPALAGSVESRTVDIGGATITTPNTGLTGGKTQGTLTMKVRLTTPPGNAPTNIIKNGAITFPTVPSASLNIVTSSVTADVTVSTTDSRLFILTVNIPFSTTAPVTTQSFGVVRVPITIKTNLVAFASNEKHSDPAGPNVFNVGEAVYKDVDASNTVSIGDTRLANAPSPYLASATVPVAAGNTDIGTTLVAFASTEKHTEIGATANVFDVGESIYKDVAADNKVSATDIRLANVPSPYASPYVATVAAANTDIGSNNANNVITRATDPGSPSVHTTYLDAKSQAFRYFISAHSVGGASGASEPRGNDAVIALGSGFSGAPADGHGGSAGSRNEWAGTFMHELGHLLNLSHGGPRYLVSDASQALITNSNINCKPNYLSLMSYARQMDNFLLSSTVPSQWRLDYSRGLSGSLDEYSLVESAGVSNPGSPIAIVWGTPADNVSPITTSLTGNTGVAVDWNGDGDMVDTGPFDITNMAGCGASVPLASSPLNDANDWANLDYNFRQDLTGQFDGFNPPPPPPITDDGRWVGIFTNALFSKPSSPAKSSGTPSVNAGSSSPINWVLENAQHVRYDTPIPPASGIAKAELDCKHPTGTTSWNDVTSFGNWKWIQDASPHLQVTLKTKMSDKGHSYCVKLIGLAKGSDGNTIYYNLSNDFGTRILDSNGGPNGDNKDPNSRYVALKINVT